MKKTLSAGKYREEMENFKHMPTKKSQLKRPNKTKIRIANKAWDGTTTMF